MAGGERLTLKTLEEAVRSLLGLSPQRVIVRRTEDISPGIGAARVFRVVVDHEHGDALPSSVILKIPDWGNKTLLDPRDPWLSRRERAFFESGLGGRLPSGVRAPSVLRIEERDGRTWVWMEDLAACLERPWRPDDVIEAARRSALFDDLYRQEHTALAAAPWLEREGYAAYAHHIPAAHENLDRVSSHPIWSRLFSADEIHRLHRCLDVSTEALAELRTFRSTLAHGDFHIRNLGFDADGSLVCIDWAHVGLAPLGSDIAILVSLYHAFGGVDGGDAMKLDRDVVAAYAEEVERLSGRSNLVSTISHTFGLWHVTWGLHVRLGPGLTYLLSAESSRDADVDNSAADIRDGCERALHYAAPMGE